MVWTVDHITISCCAATYVYDTLFSLQKQVLDFDVEEETCPSACLLPCHPHRYGAEEVPAERGATTTSILGFEGYQVFLVVAFMSYCKAGSSQLLCFNSSHYTY